MPQAQYIYGTQNNVQDVLKVTPSFREFIENRCRPESSYEQTENRLKKWFFTDLEGGNDDYISFFYCPIGLKPNNIPTMAAYGVNGRNLFDRNSRYLQLFLSDLADISGKSFFGMFGIPYFTPQEIERVASRNIGTFRLERGRFDHLNRKAEPTIPDETLKAILLRLFRKETIYILSDTDSSFFARSMEVLEYIYSFLPTQVRSATGCISAKPKAFTESIDFHNNFRLLFMVNSQTNSNIPQHIDLKQQHHTINPQSQDEIDFLNTLDDWIALPFAERETMVESLQGYLKEKEAPLNELASYVGLFDFANPKKRWWEISADAESRRYSIAELRNRYENDYIVQNHPDFQKTFKLNLPNLIADPNPVTLLDEHLRGAKTVQELFTLDENLAFFMDRFGYPRMDVDAVRKAAVRIFGTTHAGVEYRYMVESNPSGAQKIACRDGMTFQRLMAIYRTIDRRYDPDWERDTVGNLYEFWELARDHATLLRDLLDVYTYDRKTVRDWQKLKTHLSAADVEAFALSLAERVPDPRGSWRMLCVLLEFASDMQFAVSPEIIGGAADRIFSALAAADPDKLELAVRPLGDGGVCQKAVHSLCLRRIAEKRAELERAKKAVADCDRLAVSEKELQAGLASAQEKIIFQQNRAAELEGKVQSISENYEALAAKYDQCDRERSSLAQDRAGLESRLSIAAAEAESKRQALLDLEAKYSVVEAQRNDSEAAFDHADKERAELSARLTDVRANLDKATAEEQKASQGYQAVSDRLKALETEKASLDRTIGSLTFERNDLDKQLKRLRADFDNLSAANGKLTGEYSELKRSLRAQGPGVAHQLEQPVLDGEYGGRGRHRREQDQSLGKPLIIAAVLLAVCALASIFASYEGFLVRQDVAAQGGLATPVVAAATPSVSAKPASTQK